MSQHSAPVPRHPSNRLLPAALTLAATLLLLPCPVSAQQDYYWTGNGSLNVHNVREWGNADNWELNSPGSGIVPGSPPTTNLAPGPFDNVFLNGSGTTYLHQEGGASTFQRINNLTVLGGGNIIGSRYVNGSGAGSPSLLIEGNLDVQAGTFFGGPYSPNNIEVLGTFTAGSGTSVGNQGSTSDGAYWNLAGAAAVHLNGANLNHMTNNWQWNPSAWNLGTTPIVLTNQNTFNVNQNVVAEARGGVDSRGSLQINVASPISGTGGITRTGAASLHLTGNNTYSGPTNINGGILSVAGGNAIGNNSAVTLANAVSSVNEGSVQATLWLNDNETIGSLAGGGTTGGNVILNGNTLTIGGNNSSTTFAGIIAGSATGATQGTRVNQSGSWAIAPYTAEGYLYAPDPALGSGGIIKTGTGSLTLTGNNLYSGQTVIQEGFLVVNDSVLSGVSGPLGQATSAIVLGDAGTPPAASINATNVGLRFNITGPADQNLVLDRGLDMSGTTVDGRTRVLLDGGGVTDASTLTISGDIALPAASGRRFEFSAQRQGQLINITGDITGVSNSVYWNGSNQGLGTVRLSDTARTYAATNVVSNGTLIIAGSVNASGASPIGTSVLNLGDGAPAAINQLSGGQPNANNETGPINSVPRLFMETPGSTFARNINLGNVATYAIDGITGNGVANGYEIGGLNTSGTITFSGNVNSPNQANGDTNLTLSSAGGGRVEFTGNITDNPAAGSVTTVNINQFFNHPDLNHADAGAAVGSARTGTVVLSGTDKTFTGPTAVHGGTLLVNTGLDTEGVFVQTGATLGGFGQISGGAGSSVAGTLAPGDPETALGIGTLGFGGDLLMAATSSMEFQLLSPASHDRIEFTSGGITLDADMEIVVAGVTGWDPQVGDVYQIISGPITANGFDPSSILLPALSGGAIWDTSQFLSDGILMVTPEPSRALMLALAALALFSRRRR